MVQTLKISRSYYLQLRLQIYKCWWTYSKPYKNYYGEEFVTLVGVGFSGICFAMCVCGGGLSPAENSLKLS